MKTAQIHPASMLVAVAAGFILGLLVGKSSSLNWSQQNSPTSVETANQNLTSVEESVSINEPPPRAVPGTSLLVGKIESFSRADNGLNATVRLVEWVSGDDAAEQASIAAGRCTVEKAENDECTPNNFFVFDTQKVLTLAVAPSAEIRMYPHPELGYPVSGNDNNLPDRVDIGRLLSAIEQPIFPKDIIPFRISTKGGVVAAIWEMYVP